MLKPLAYLAAFLLLIGLLIAIQYAGPSGRASVFVSMDFDAAQAAAVRSSPPKLLVAVFVGDDCQACDKMEQTVWSDPRMAEWVHRRALAVRIHRATDPGHARALGVQTLPAAILLDGKTPLVKIEGAAGVREVIDKFDAALANRSKPAATEPQREDKPAEPPLEKPTTEPDGTGGTGGTGGATSPESPPTASP
ncbi:MAG: thioredoxin family protein [Phycisphaerales bacterium]|nr:thioredoxin family protein [Phycisphaerales bacterium]